MNESKEPLTVLWVDDEVMYLSVMAEIMTMEGFFVTTASNAQDAWSIFSKSPHSFDIIVSDNDMPGMKGLELLGKVNHQKKDIISILVSGRDVEERIENIDSFLRKPFEIDELTQVIDGLIRLKGKPITFERAYYQKSA
ncbi:response regulator [Deltaproteobacteria bacterium TL4]